MSVIVGPDGAPISSRGGYGDAGASRIKRALKGFEAISGSVRTDIDAHNSTLRQRARMLYMSTPIAASAIRTNRTNVVGLGLKLKSRLKRDALGLDEDEAQAAERHIEDEFDIWAKDKRHCDATGVNDFCALQQLALSSWLMSGDAFVLLDYAEPTEARPYSLRLRIVEADLVSTPPSSAYSRGSRSLIDGVPVPSGLRCVEGVSESGNLIHDGVEVAHNGAVTAYHICDAYPNAVAVKKREWTRVEAYGLETGDPNILQIMDTERPGQYRGVPYLAGVIEPILQLRRYTESELMASVIESFFTAFIISERASELLPGNEAGERERTDAGEVSMGAAEVFALKDGEDIKFADPKRPTSGFGAFTRAISEQVGAALEIPADLLLKSFNRSYSASRAALLEAWKAFKMRRDWFVSDFCCPAYAAWFSEAVAIGRIDAPGFFDDPLIRAAWLGAEWIGPSQGQLDPVKEIRAALMAVGQGLLTREQATQIINGGNWDSNIEQLAKENELLALAGAMPAEYSEINSGGIQDEQDSGDDDGGGDGTSGTESE